MGSAACHNAANGVISMLVLLCGVTFSALVMTLLKQLVEDNSLIKDLQMSSTTSMSSTLSYASWPLWSLGFAYMVPGVIGCIAFFVKRKCAYITQMVFTIISLLVMGLVFIGAILVLGLLMSSNPDLDTCRDNLQGQCECGHPSPVSADGHNVDEDQVKSNLLNGLLSNSDSSSNDDSSWNMFGNSDSSSSDDDNSDAYSSFFGNSDSTSSDHEDGESSSNLNFNSVPSSSIFGNGGSSSNLFGNSDSASNLFGKSDTSSFNFDSGLPYSCGDLKSMYGKSVGILLMIVFGWILSLTTTIISGILACRSQVVQGIEIASRPHPLTVVHMATPTDQDMRITNAGLTLPPPYMPPQTHDHAKLVDNIVC